MQKTDVNSQKNFLLGGQLSYRKENSNLEYNLLWDNVLNMKNFQFIDSRTTQFGKDETITAALKGYIIGGLKYYF